MAISPIIPVPNPINGYILLYGIVYNSTINGYESIVSSGKGQKSKILTIHMGYMGYFYY